MRRHPLSSLAVACLLFCGGAMGDDKFSQAADSAAQGAQNAAMMSMYYQQAAKGTDDGAMKNMLLMMAMQQQMQSLESSRASKQNKDKSEDKDKDKIKIPQPEPLPKNSELKPVTPDEKNLVDLTDVKINKSGQDSNSDSESKDNNAIPTFSLPTDLARNLKKEVATEPAPSGKEPRTASDANGGATVPNTIPDRKEKTDLPGQSPSTNVSPVLASLGSLGGGSRGAGPSSESTTSSSGSNSAPANEMPGRKPSAVNTGESGGGGGGEASTSSGGGGSGDSFFDMLLKGKGEEAAVGAPGTAEDPGAEGASADSSGPSFNIFQVAQLRYQYAAYKEKRLRTKP
jgi:hypothetical protein